MRPSWPLVGRREQLHAIDAAVSTAGVGGVVIRGAAGVGKSRLAREALQRATTRGCDTRWTVGSTSARSIPLGAFSAWAPSGVTDTVGLLRGVVEALATPSSDAGVVLCVDDAHLLDDLSAFVVHQIVQRGAAKLILTVRDGAPIPAAVAELWGIATFDRIDVQPLSPDESAALLAETLGGPIAPDAATRLWELTRGNALYLRTIVERELADGRLVRQQGFWRWVGDPVVPPDLADLVESRIGMLSGPACDVIDLLAVGEPIDLAMLTGITGGAAVEEADTRGLVTLEPAGAGIEVRLAHPLYGEVRRSRAATTRLRRLRGLVASALEADGDDVRVVVRRAALAVGSDLAPDAALLVKAARGAIWLADLPLADRLAEAAVQAGGGPEPDFLRAHALSWLGHGEGAEAVLAGVDVDALSESERAKFAFLRASNLLWALGEPNRAKEIIDGAADVVDPRVRVHVDAFLTVYWFATDHPSEALGAAESLVLEGIPVVGAEVAWALAQITGDAGDTDEALRVAAAGYDVATRTLDAPHMRFNIADAEVGALLLAGRIAEARDVAERTRAEAANLPGAAQLLGPAVVGRAALGAGAIREAVALLHDAADGLSASHASGWGYRYRVAEATALAIQGSSAEAEETLWALDRVRRRFRMLDGERSLAAAWVAASQGAVSEAIAMLADAAERSGAAGRLAEEVLCRQTAAQFGDRSGAARLRELAELVEGTRAGVAAGLAEALERGDGAALAASSEDFERLGDLVAAVDAAAQAALVFRRQDKKGSALTCSTRAEALAASGGIVTPALLQASEALPLTDREHEIVSLVGAGLSNRAIADRLTLSVRTVESHIYRAMSKTGTNSREEVAALLRQVQ